MGEFLLPQQSVLSNSSTRLTHLLNRFQPSPETVVLLLAVLISGSTGMGVVTFQRKRDEGFPSPLIPHLSESYHWAE